MGSSITIPAFLFMGWASCASDLGLMLTPAEEKGLARAEARAQEKKDPVGGFRTLRLDGIIYSGPDSWILWINGHPVKSGEAMQTLQVLEVTPDSVEMIWRPKADQQRQVCLKPHETVQDTGGVP